MKDYKIYVFSTEADYEDLNYDNVTDITDEYQDDYSIDKIVTTSNKGIDQLIEFLESIDDKTNIQEVRRLKKCLSENPDVNPIGTFIWSDGVLGYIPIEFVKDYE